MSTIRQTSKISQVNSWQGHKQEAEDNREITDRQKSLDPLTLFPLGSLQNFSVTLRDKSKTKISKKFDCIGQTNYKNKKKVNHASRP